MRRTYLLCLTWVLIAGVGLAEDFWTKKEYMQWTDEEVKKVMTNSPWAKDVTVRAPMVLLIAAADLFDVYVLLGSLRRPAALVSSRSETA